MEDLYIGKLLDNRYEILEQIGSGGMSMVYKAKCHRLNRLVALKILKPDLAEDEEFRRRFHDESQAVAMLSHPNIVAVYDVSKSTELEYIVMELIDGITLKQYVLRKGEPLNWREALHFIIQIVKALGHAHSRGIIHRDIKPQNIMVLRDGSVKVADFGIARLTSAHQSTLTQEALGSVHYISPEQARGSRIDCRSDIYSAGVVLYEMLTGRLPFEGDSPVSVAIQHINSIPLPPRELNPEIPEALETITMRAMAPSVEQRYVNADEMLADLEEFRKNPNINFEYSAADLFAGGGTDEPTQTIPVSKQQGQQRHSGQAAPPPHPRQEDAEEDEDDEEVYPTARRRRKRSNVLPVLMGIGAMLMFFVGIGYFLYVTFFSGLLEPEERYTVPKLIGKTLTEVQMDSSITGIFAIEQSGSVYSDLPIGQIISQEPDAGIKRKAGEDMTISVVVSAGTESVTMKSLAGKEKREAYIIIQDLGLVADEPETIHSETVPRGYVISFTPAEGTVVFPGDTVHMVISDGPETKPVALIEFTGMTIEEARRNITAMKLVVGQVTYEEDMTLPGTVIEQSEKAYTEVPEGTVIDLVVSKGPDETIDPTPSTTPEDPPPSTTPENPTPGVPASESPAPSPTTGDVPVVVPVTPTPAPVPKKKSIPVDLGGGEGSVQVTITVGGVNKYDNTVGRNMGTVYISVEGTGVQEVKTYLDGTLVNTQSVDFSA